MGFLFPIMLAVGVHALAEADVTAGVCVPWAGLVLLPLPYMFSALLERARVRGHFRRAELLARALRLTGVGAYAALVLGFRWVECVRGWTGAGLSLLSWPEPELALSFAPYIVYQLAVIDAEVRGVEPRRAARRKLRTFQARMFASALVPLGMYFVVAVLVGVSEPVRLNVQHVGLFEASFVAALAAVLAMFLPTMLRNTWETEPLPPGLQRDICEAVARRAQFRARDVLVWRTGNLMANAVIVSLGARRRIVLFSDSLLAILSLRELGAVYAHEIGHAKRRHVSIFLSWTLAFFLGGNLLAGWLFPTDDWSAIGVLVAAVVTWYFGFGWLSRRFELEADLYSYELLRDPDALMSALQRVGGRLRDVAGWRHFSTDDRVAFMHRVATDPDFAPAFKRRLRLWARLGVVLAVVVTSLQVLVLARDLGRDRAVVDLSLGRYAAALTRVEAQEDRNADLERLARAGAAIERAQAGAVDVAILEQHLTRALESGALDEARVLSELLIYRGQTEQLAVAETLQALAQDSTEVARLLLRETRSPWRELLGPHVDQ